MTDLLSGAADGTLTGWKLWFTKLHVKYCPGCAAALEGLKELCVRLAKLGAQHTGNQDPALSKERWSSIETAWEAIENRSPNSS